MNSFVSSAVRAIPALGLGVLLLGGAPAEAASTGAVSGWVKDERGDGQMGAAVAVLAPDGRVARRVFTDPDGRFLVEGLFPGLYAVQVTLNRFMPLLREGIRVPAGGAAVLDVNLRGVFAGLQLLYPAAGEIRDMTDDWKWVLRTEHRTRPAFRMLPTEEARERREVLKKVSGAFSDTRGFAEVAGGAGVQPAALANRGDLGATFAVATSLFGETDVTLSGNLGREAAATAPAQAFRATFQRDLGLSSPEVSVTARQLRSSAAGRALLDPRSGATAPELRTFTVGYADRLRLSPATRLEYGFLYESVDFLTRLNFVSPYARLVRELGDDRSVEVRYASGVPRPDMAVEGGRSLREQVSMLGLFPRVSLRDGAAAVQRSEHVEVAYREKIGKGLLEVGVYQDSVSDAAVSVSDAAAGAFGHRDVLPDLYARTSTINGGGHRVRGYRVSYARKLADNLQAALGYGMGGVITAGDDAESPPTDSVDELRGRFDTRRTHMVMASVSTRTPLTHTRIVSSYQWTGRDAILAPDLYNDFASRSEPGLNLIIRQPLPFSAGLPGKIEAAAELRNILGGGRNAVQTRNGRTLYLLQSVRGYRGSLSFIF